MSGISGAGGAMKSIASYGSTYGSHNVASTATVSGPGSATAAVVVNGQVVAFQTTNSVSN
jgi:hypothetical protein